MVNGELTAGQVPMSKELRAHSIQQRMDDLELGPVRLAIEASVDRKTVNRALKGGGSDTTYRLLEEALDRLEGRVGPEESAIVSQPAPRPETDRVVFRIVGLARAKEVIIEGPRDMYEELRESVERLLEGNDTPDFPAQKDDEA